MNQKESIRKMYKDESNTDVFDSERKKYSYQRYKHKIESDFIIDTIGMAGTMFIDDKVKVLDVACGTGRMFREVVKDPSVEYYGIDTSEEMMEHLKENAKKMKRNAFLEVGDATDMPYEDNTFDVVFTMHLTWHLPQDLQVKIIKEMMRVTKKGGYVVFDILNKNFVWEKTKHLFGKEKLDTIYKMGFEDVEGLLYGHEYEVEKLSDFPVKSSFAYSLLNVVNLSRKILPMNMYHMLYFRVKKDV